MIGLIGTAAGALALEVRRIRHRGSQEELKQLKVEERRLQELLEATNRELERLKESSEAAHEREQQLQADKVRLEDSVQTLQQNNTKLVLTNVLLLNKTKHLEESTRELVARTEDLQHQAEQTQRERMAELAQLKERVSTVLNAYLSKDMELQTALQEMQAMGIELVPVSQGSDGSGVVEFETKLVLESPHRMQRLMSAAATAGKTLALPSSSSNEQDMPALSAFSMGGLGTDPTTGMPRVALGWRTSMQFPSSAGRLTAGGADAEQQGQDQAPGRVAAAVAQLQDKSAADTAAAAAAKAASSKQPAGKQKRVGGGGGFSLGWIGSPSKASSSSSSGVGGKKAPVIVPSIRGMDDDDDFGGGMGGGGRALAIAK